MKISGVDRCGCLIQSARLESSRSPPLPAPPPSPPPSPLSTPPLSSSLSIRFQPAITIGCDSSPSESNPFGESTNSLFVPDLLFPLFLSFPFSAASLLDLSFRSLVLSPIVPIFPVLMTPFLLREFLPRERFATEGYSYQFPGAIRPFILPSVPAPSSALAQRLILNKLETST